MTYCNTDKDCPADIREKLSAIEREAGDRAVSDVNPCGLAAYYDVGAALPWRIADDWATERFETFDLAIDAAGDWADASE